MDSVLLPAEEVPVRGEFDVIVVGGGLAGCCAAIGAARAGAKTLLAEAMAFVGGNGTTGLPITTFCASHAKPPVIVGGVARELIERVREKGGFNSDPERDDWMEVDCDRLEIALTHLLDEAGVTLLCHAPLLSVQRSGPKLTHAVFLGQDEPAAYAGECFVDCSGGAAVALKAGLETPMGRARDGRTQPMTLTFTVAGIDRPCFEAANGCAGLGPRWAALREKEPIRNPRLPSALSCPTFIPGRVGEASFNVTRIIVEKGTDALQLTNAEREGRYQIEEFVDRFLRPHVPGFGNCWLSRIAQRVGVRETRRIVGEYEIQKDDLLCCRKFADSVACNSYPVDIHNPTGGDSRYEIESIPPGGYYTIPYRALVAKGVENLLAAGRCISASHEALGAVRVLSCAMPTGQAAGVAAALIAAGGGAARNLSVQKLRSVLREQRAIVE
jgi:hypothetical protein